MRTETEFDDETHDQYDAIVLRLVERRKQLSLTPADVAKVLGIQRATFWRWENGYVPRSLYLILWARTLGCAITLTEGEMNLVQAHLANAAPEADDPADGSDHPTEAR